MKCPSCSNTNTKVVDSRLNQTADITRRRRECDHCGSRFTTYERVEIVMPVVTKKDGRREAFLRDKIFTGIQKACQKRSIATEQIEKTVSDIERKIQSYGLKEIPARAVGQMVMAALHGLDTVAYIRFSSVYREFKDVEEFVSELQEAPQELQQNDSLTFPFIDTTEDNSEPQKSPRASS